MKNFYFLISLVLSFFSPSTYAQSEHTQRALMITDNVALYGQQLDSVRNFVENLMQSSDVQLEVNFSQYTWTHTAGIGQYDLLVFVGEQSLLSLDPLEKKQFEQLYDSGYTGKVPSVLGLFFQEDREIPEDTRWAWFDSLQIRLEEEAVQEENFPMNLTASELHQDDRVFTKPVCYTYILPVTETHRPRIFLSYLADKEFFLRNHEEGDEIYDFYARHYQEALEWTLEKKDYIEQRTDILRIKKRATASRIEFSWQDYLASELCIYHVQRSQDGVFWESVFTVSGHEDPGHTFRYSEKNLDLGQSMYRICRMEEQTEKMYSDIILVGVHLPDPGVRLFPNPVQDVMYLNLDETYHSARISIHGPGFGPYTLDLASSTEDSDSPYMAIPVHHMSPGLYHVQIQTENKRQWKTFLKF